MGIEVSSTGKFRRNSDFSARFDCPVIKAPLKQLTAPAASAAVPVTESGACTITIAAGQTEAGTIAAPTFVGQVIHINAGAVGAGGTRKITSATTLNQTGNNEMTFGAVADSITLIGLYVGTSLLWRILQNDGVALSTAA